MKKEYLIYKLSEEMKEATRIDNELFPKFDVKRGLRNEDGFAGSFETASEPVGISVEVEAVETIFAALVEACGRFAPTGSRRTLFKLPCSSNFKSSTPDLCQYFNALSTSFSVQLKMSAIDDSSSEAETPVAFRKR